MRSILIIILFLQGSLSFAQSKIEMYVEGKRYKNSETGLIIQYGYISSLNTYGLTFTNKNGVKFYFMNCDKYVASDEESMTVRNCINPQDGSDIGTVYIYRRRFVGMASGVRVVYEIIEE